MECGLRTTLPRACGLLESEISNMQDRKARMKQSKKRQKYYYDHHCSKELLPLRPGDHVRVKPKPGSKEWRTGAVVQQHASHRSYVLDAGGWQIRPNTVALRTDFSRAVGFWKRHANTIPQLEADPGNAHVVPTIQASTHMKRTAQDHHPNASAAQESPPQSVLTQGSEKKTRPVVPEAWQKLQFIALFPWLHYAHSHLRSGYLARG